MADATLAFIAAAAAAAAAAAVVVGGGGSGVDVCNVAVVTAAATAGVHICDSIARTMIRSHSPSSTLDNRGTTVPRSRCDARRRRWEGAGTMPVLPLSNTSKHTCVIQLRRCVVSCVAYCAWLSIVCARMKVFCVCVWIRFLQPSSVSPSLLLLAVVAVVVVVVVVGDDDEEEKRWRPRLIPTS